MNVTACPECGAEATGTDTAPVAVCAACGAPLSDDVLVYEMEGWEPAEREALGKLLAAEGIPHRFEADELLVPEDAEERVDEVMDRVEFPDALDAVDEDDGTDDEAVYAVMSDLFVAADRVAEAGEVDVGLAADLLSAAMAAAATPPPYGVEARVWASVQESAAAVAEALEAEQGDDRVAAGATRLRDLLRHYV